LLARGILKYLQGSGITLDIAAFLPHSQVEEPEQQQVEAPASVETSEPAAVEQPASNGTRNQHKSRFLKLIF
jgi:hypothetical protein